MANKVFNSYEEFQMAFLPELTFQKLKETLCESFGLIHPYEHELKESESGDAYIEIAKIPFSSTNNVSDLVRNFYEKRKFNVEEEPNSYANILNLKKEGEIPQSAMIFDHETSYLIWIKNNSLLNKVAS